tara:strand:+ start:2073 stop:2594 length:522 start_codon:yes stop_codon:yes gene_type:complete
MNSMTSQSPLFCPAELKGYPMVLDEKQFVKYFWISILTGAVAFCALTIIEEVHRSAGIRLLMSGYVAFLGGLFFLACENYRRIQGPPDGNDYYQMTQYVINNLQFLLAIVLSIGFCIGCCVTDTIFIGDAWKNNQSNASILLFCIKLVVIAVSLYKSHQNDKRIKDLNTKLET